jgi:hypothetical protein
VPVARDREPERYSKGALAAVAASALVVGVAAGIIIARRRVARRPLAPTALGPAAPVALPEPEETRVPTPEPVPMPPTGWRARLLRDRTQRRLAKLTAAAVVVALAFWIPVQRSEPTREVTLSVRESPRPQPEILFGPDTLSKVVVDPRLEPGSTVRLRAAQPECPGTLIGRVTSGEVTAWSEPSPYSEPIATFPRINSQGSVQVFELVGDTTDRRGLRWYEAVLPMRPNGTRGFIRAERLQLERTYYRIVVSQRQLTLKLYDHCKLAHTYPIGLGKESTPTPVGRFYIASLMKPPTEGSVYGPWAYGLSAFSDAITDWTGGGVIGIHGTNDPTSIGQRVSHGCIRMRNEDVDALVEFLPLGTPVKIGPP